MRKVYEGQSRSGIRGLFDHFAMVASLRPGENPAEVAKLYRCELVTREEVEAVAFKTGNSVSSIAE